MTTMQMQCLSTTWLKVILIFLFPPLKGNFASFSARYIKSSHENKHFDKYQYFSRNKYMNFTVLRVFKLKQTKILSWPYDLVLTNLCNRLLVLAQG